jgi:hypothetical protein
MPSPERPPEPLAPVTVPVEEDAFGDFGGATEAVPTPQVQPAITEIAKSTITEIEPDVAIDTIEEPMSPPNNERGDNNSSLSFDANTFSLESAPQPSIKDLKESSPKASPEAGPSSFKPAMMMPPPMAENTNNKLSVFDALAEADLAVENEDFGGERTWGVGLD